MGVFIKGMEMPTRCGRCDMCITESDGDIDFHKACCITGAVIGNLGEKMEDCPLVPVPTHGRLGDMDALHKLFLEKAKENKGVGGAMVAMAALCIANAPAIVPAEWEDEGEA